MGQILFPWDSALFNCMCSVFSSTQYFKWCQCYYADFFTIKIIFCSWYYIQQISLHLSLFQGDDTMTVMGRVLQTRGPKGTGDDSPPQQSVPGRDELPAIQLGGGRLRQVFTESTPFDDSNKKQTRSLTFQRHPHPSAKLKYYLMAFPNNQVHFKGNWGLERLSRSVKSLTLSEAESWQIKSSEPLKYDTSNHLQLFLEAS